MTRTALCILSLVLLISGCTDDRYAVERSYWHLEKNAKRLLYTQESIPSLEWEKTTRAIERFIKRHPGRPQSLSAQFVLLKLLLEQKKFPEARSLSKTIMEQHKDSAKIVSEALFLLGQSYEKEGKWHEAVLYYRQLRIHYPETLRAFLIPAYIARYYKIARENDKMQAAYRDAADYYISQGKKFAGTNTGYNSLLMAAQCYRSLNDWKNTAKTLERIGDEYEGKQNVQPLMVRAAEIYRYQLENEEKAEEIRARLRQHEDRDEHD